MTNRLASRILLTSAWVLAAALIVSSTSHVGPLALACNAVAVVLILLALRDSPRVIAWTDRALLRGSPGR